MAVFNNISSVFSISVSDFLTSLTVTPEMMNEKAASVEIKIMTMKRVFAEVERTVNRTKGYWIGEAGDEHRQFYYSKQEDINEIFARLTEDVQDLRTMAAVYSKTENEAKEIAADLPSDVII